MSSINKLNSGRTPLFQILKRAIQVFQILKEKPGLSVAEILETGTAQNISRREFLKSAAVVGLGLGATQFMTACNPLFSRQQKLTDRKIVIIGAGMAGLNCALELEKYGYLANLYEAAKRSGGRMYTAHNLMGAGLTTEIGGEFIDSTHADILNLVKEFDLELIDTAEDPLSGSFFFDGQHRSLVEVVEAFIPLAERIKIDSAKSGETVNYQEHGNALEFDKMSMRLFKISRFD